MSRRDQVTNKFSLEYVEQSFWLWYQKAKPSSRELLNIIPENDDGVKPTRTTLTKWIRESWKDRAQILDDQVRQNLEDKMIAERVEMLSRHADVGVGMQDRALAVLKDKDLKIGASTAVRLLVEGVEMERASRGVSTALEKIMDTSEEELLKEVEELLLRTEVQVSQLSE